MKKTHGLCLLLWFSFTMCFGSQLVAQDSLRIYTWEEALLAPKDSVFRLDASKQKWEELPAELFAFTHLKSLDISKNKLTTLPAEMNVFTELRTLDAGKNKLQEFPVAICSLTQLKKIMLNRNYITSLPSCIGYFSQLKVLDLWDNPIESLPAASSTKIENPSEETEVFPEEQTALVPESNETITQLATNDQSAVNSEETALDNIRPANVENDQVRQVKPSLYEWSSSTRLAEKMKMRVSDDQSAQSGSAVHDGDGLSLFGIIILIILILWLVGAISGGWGLGGLIHILLVIALILLILWLLRII